MNNQPEKLIYGEGKPDYNDLDVRFKYVWTKQTQEDELHGIEYKCNVEQYLQSEELFPMQNYEGIPEFDMVERDQFDLSLPGKVPKLRFTSHITEDELLPLPTDYSLRYNEVHYEIERWSLFRTLPIFLQTDRQMAQLYQKMKDGEIEVPDYIKDVNPPSLWTYYYTLPKWARDDPIVKNVVMSFEYRQPGVDIRQKETMLNLACSFLRPIDPTLKEVLCEAAGANKIHLNMKLGNQMINELPFYLMEPDELGSDDEEASAS